MLNSLERKWELGFQVERAFWRKFIADLLSSETHGDYFDERLCGALKFQHPHLIEHIESDPVRVLDIGAGPVTHVGTLHPTKTIEITAIDPLAEFFGEILHEFDIKPETSTKAGNAEHLDDLLEPNTFDFAFSRKALEYCSDPLTAISQVISILKPGSYFTICGICNESEKQNYQGLHLWNIEVREGVPVLWRPGITIDVAEVFGDEATITRATNGDWYAIDLCKVA